MDPQLPPAPVQPSQPTGGYAPAWQPPLDEAGPAPGVRFAGHGGRLLAYLVDTVIIGVVFVVLTLVAVALVAASGPGDAGAAAVGGILLFLLVGLGISILYFPWFWANGGQTPGMRLFRQRVVRDADGGPVGWGAAFLRLAGYWINGIVLYVGFAWILVDRRRRGWHDLIAGTVVIEER